MKVLVVNAGSSSVKLRLLDESDGILVEHELPAPGSRVDDAQLKAALRSGLSQADAVGHRIVHGGQRFHSATVIDTDVEAALRELSDLAPLHQPKSLAALDAVSAQLPDVPAVACFDTAFHTTLPAAAATYALPLDWRERWGLRRYGFHGLSHAWMARRVPQLLNREDEPLRIVSAHLGTDASLCAIADGESVDTTMGFTSLEGLVMATRSGSIDPGMLMWLLEHEGLSARALADALEHRSGMLGLSGSSDMAEIVDRAEDGDQRCELALAVYLRGLRAGIAAMAAALGGIDALAFTGGVGERSTVVRRRVVEGLDFLGLAIDAEANRAGDPDRDLSAPGGCAAVVVLAAREDIEIARQTRAALSREAADRPPG